MTSLQDDNISEFRKVQEEWKRKAEAGECTKEEAIRNILDKAISLIQGLKIEEPEVEYMYMGRNIN